MAPFRNSGPVGFGIRLGHRGFGWWAVPRLVLGVALLVLILMACVALFRYLRHGLSGSRPQLREAEAILAERFARGEIGADELRSRLEALRSMGGQQNR